MSDQGSEATVRHSPSEREAWQEATGCATPSDAARLIHDLITDLDAAQKRAAAYPRRLPRGDRGLRGEEVQVMADPVWVWTARMSTRTGEPVRELVSMCVEDIPPGSGFDDRRDAKQYGKRGTSAPRVES